MRRHPSTAPSHPPRRRPQPIALAAALVGLCTLAATALAQQRADWSPTGSLEGREAVNPAQLSAEERRHLPVLLLPEVVHAGRPFDFVVQVGVDPHVMNEVHHIDWVEVAVGDRRAFVADLTAAVGYPIVRVPLVLREPTELTVRAHCNLHGTWRTRRSIRVR